MKNKTLCGILNVNKPKGFTSHDVVNKLRRILNTKKIGHTGTLDPMAVGVLPVCIGKATKIIQFMDNSKAYRAYIKLGINTDTYDTDGKTLETNEVNLDIPIIKQYLNDFQGDITQIPPMYSAVHYKGKRLYEYARSNIQIEDIPSRNVSVSSITLIDIADTETKNPVLTVDIDCSGGTYIRSIVHDLGVKLGYGATLCGLTRTKSGKFTLETCKTLEEIDDIYKNGKIYEILIDPVCATNLECCKINEEQSEKIKMGQSIEIEDIKQFTGKKIQLIFQDELAAIAEIREDKIFPDNVFI
jgi:tRNA pseudouridine55 synthase